MPAVAEERIRGCRRRVAIRRQRCVAASRGRGVRDRTGTVSHIYINLPLAVPSTQLTLACRHDFRLFRPCGPRHE